MNTLYRALTFLAAILLITPAYGQDNHYESLQLGTRNAILSGAAISRWVDQTAVVNNPATMIFSKGAGLSLSTSAAVFDKVGFENGLGDGVTVKSTAVIFYPGFIAGELPFLKKEGKRTVGFAIYSHAEDQVNFASRTSYTANLIYDDVSPGEEAYVGLYGLESDLGETAFALGWGERLSENWALGLTMQGFFRHHSYNQTFASRVTSDPARQAEVEVAGASGNYDVSYNAFLVSLKGGIAWQKEDWQAGLTLIVPTVRMWGSGEMLVDLSLDNVIAFGNERRSYYANTYVDKLKSTYKYPLQISVGISHEFPKVHTSFSATYYSKIKRYTIMDPGEIDFIQPPSDENVLYTPGLLRVYSSNKPVFNAAASAVWSIARDKNFLLGIRTDRHFQDFPDPDDDGDIIVTKIWDRHHISGGFEFSWNRSHWIVGVQYSRGRSTEYPQPASFTDVSEENQFLGEYHEGTIKQTALTFSISYSFQFIPQVENQ